MVIEITTILDKSLRESIHNFSIHGSIHNFLQFLGSLIKYPVYRPPPPHPPFLLSSDKNLRGEEVVCTEVIIKQCILFEIFL